MGGLLLSTDIGGILDNAILSCI